MGNLFLNSGFFGKENKTKNSSFLWNKNLMILFSLAVIFLIFVPVVSAYTVTVKTNINGASVYLDGYSKCTTSTPWYCWWCTPSCTISSVSKDWHTFKATKLGYTDASTSKYISSDTTVGTLYLYKNKFDVTVKTNENGANVYLDGSYKCTTSGWWSPYSCTISSVSKGCTHLKPRS